MNTYMKNGRIFGVLAVILSAAIALMMFPFKAYAVETQTVMLNASGDRAEIVLDFPQAAAEEISSLQISLRVSADSSQARVEFVQAALPAKIVESRYHSDTNILNIYIAGTKPLFNKSNPILSLGYIKISGEGTAAADVEIVRNSLKFVRGTELVVQDTGVEYPDAVRISYSNGGSSGESGFIDPVTPPSTTEKPSVTEAPSVTGKPAETENPAVTEKPSSTERPAVTDNTAGNEKPPVTNAPEVSDNSSVIIYPPVTDSQGGGNSPAVVPGTDVTLGADTSALVSAMDVAESLNKSDFSEQSYKSLMEAVDSAKALLNNIYATQDEVDEALLVIENAIGMLELKNTPSGGDVNDSEESGGIQGSNGVQNDPQGGGQNGGDASNGEPGGSGAEGGGEGSSSDPENGDGSDGSGGGSGNNVSAWVMVLIVIGVLLAVALAAAYVTAMGKKKTKRKSKGKGKNKGKHTKSE